MRKSRMFGRLSLSAFAAAAIAVSASAQITNDWLNLNSGNFSDNANWATNSQPVFPTDGVFNTNVLRFFGTNTGPTFITNDFATQPFAVHGLNFANAGTLTNFIVGGTLRFQGDGVTTNLPFITKSASVSVIRSGVQIATNLNLAGAGGTVIIEGQVTESGGSYGIVKTGGGAHRLLNQANAYTGGTLIQAGTLALEITNNNATMAGSGPIVMTGGTLALRNDGNGTRTYGAGSGYDVTLTANATIDVNRGTANVGSNIRHNLGALNITNAQLTTSGGNNHVLGFNGVVTIASNVTFNVGNAKDTAAYSLTIANDIVAAVPGTRLTKTGADSMAYLGTNAPNHDGGTIINRNGLVWDRATTNTIPANTTVAFGTGDISLNSGGYFGFRVTTNTTLANNFVIRPGIGNGQSTNYGGGQIYVNPSGGTRARVTLTGNIDLGGDLAVISTSGTGADAVPARFTGTVTVNGGDRSLIGIGGSGSTSGTTANQGTNSIVFSGPIVGAGNKLNVEVNDAGGITFSGTNTGLGSMHIQAGNRGNSANTGRVRIMNSNSMPAGIVTVDPYAFVSFGSGLTNLGMTSFAQLTNRFGFRAGSVFALENLNGINAANPINLSASGLNRDIWLGASLGNTMTLTTNGSITPFGTTYKLGGGGGAITIGGTNVLTGANSLWVNPAPYDGPIASVQAATVTINASNDFSGGVVIQQGTFQINAGLAGNTPVGTNVIRNYGTFDIRGGAGSLAAANGLDNDNEVINQLNSQIQIGNTDVFTNPLTNRWGDNAAINLAGSRVNFINRNTTNAVGSEDVGAINFDFGSRLNVNVSQNSNGNAFTLTADSLNRINRGTLAFLHSATSLSNDVLFGASSKVLVSGAAPAVVNGMVAPYMVNETTRSFLTYDVTAGFTNATFTSTNINTALATDIALINTNVAVNTIVAAPTTVHALRVDVNSQVSGEAITIGSGGVIFNGNSTNRQQLIFNDGSQNIEALVFVPTGTALISNVITAASITKFGDGAITIATNQVHTGGWDIQRGTIQVNTTTAGLGGNNQGLGTQNANNIVRLLGSGATLNLRGTNNNLTYDSGRVVVVDGGAITADWGGDGRAQTFAPLGFLTTNYANGPLGAIVRFDIARSRQFLAIGGMTELGANTTFNIRNTDANRESGSTNALILAGGLTANNKILRKVGNGTLEILGDNSGTVSGLTTEVMGGTVALGHNLALGGVDSTVNIASNAVLQLSPNMTGFSLTSGAVKNFEAGSALRVTSATNLFTAGNTVEKFIVPANVHFQAATFAANNLTNGFTNKVLQLNGGTFEGYRFGDDSRNANVTNGFFALELNADSKIGQSGVDVGLRAINLIQLLNITETGGSRSLTKIGLDTVTLSGTNTYTGGTIVQDGILQNGRANALPTNGNITVQAFGTYNMNNFAQAVGVVNGSGFITNSGGGAAEALTINHSATGLFSGIIAGGLSVTKTGTGLQEITGNNTYTGGTIINGGNLRVSNTSGSGTGTNRVLINTNGTLSGTGFIGGTVTNNGGTIAPGASPGVLSIAGDLINVSSNSVFSIEIASQGGLANVGVGYDQLIVGGTVNISNMALVVSVSPFVGGWQLNDEYTVLNNTGVGSILGEFTDGVGGTNLLASGSSIFVDGGGVELAVLYNGGTGNDLILKVVAVPEPGTVGMFVIGGALCAWHLMRRRRA